ncbi:DUF6896 domain-containing protein [Halovulum sp. GXIMD14793]
MSLNDKLRLVIEAYLRRVATGLDLFRSQIGETHPLHSWRSGHLLQKGRLGENLGYEFHGVGCAFTFPDCRVDFDFGPDGRTDGFDVWRLGLFVDSCPQNFPYYASQSALENDFSSAVEARRIVKLERANCNLYYLNSER